MRQVYRSLHCRKKKSLNGTCYLVKALFLECGNNILRIPRSVSWKLYFFSSYKISTRQVCHFRERVTASSTHKSGQRKLIDFQQKYFNKKKRNRKVLILDLTFYTSNGYLQWKLDIENSVLP